LNKLQLKAAGTQGMEIHARAQIAAGFSMAGAAVALRPSRTDSVSRGLSISFLT